MLQQMYRVIFGYSRQISQVLILPVKAREYVFTGIGLSVCFMKEHHWLINIAATAIPLAAHSPLWWQSAIAFTGSCTLSEYILSS